MKAGAGAKRPRAKAPAKAKDKATKELSASSASDSDASSSSGDGDDVTRRARKKSAARMPRIAASERVCVENWLQKWRKDGKMQNARWIRNGGAKGQTMTATSCEVKTLGAYESLAVYVNKSLKYAPTDPRFWNVDVSKKRWVSLYKSFKDAMLLASKGNSTAGCSLLEIQTRTTSLLVKQKAKCASFEVLRDLYAGHPSVTPVHPKEVGAGPNGAKDTEGAAVTSETDMADSAVVTASTVAANTAGSGVPSPCDTTGTHAADGSSNAPPPVPLFPAVAPLAEAAPTPVGGAAAPAPVGRAAAPAPVGGAAAPAPVGGAAAPAPVAAAAAPAKSGKVAAPFHLKPSKEPKRLDLGEAYLQAQLNKTSQQASQAAAKLKADFILAMVAAGKTPEETKAMLALL